MGFLDKVKKNTTDTAAPAAPAAKPNPFAAKKPNPLATKKEEVPVEEKKEAAPAPKPNPFAKKAPATPAPAPVAEAKPATPAKPNPFAKKAPVAPAPIPVEEKEPELTEEQKAEISAQEDMVAEGNLGRDEAEVQKEMNPDEVAAATKPETVPVEVIPEGKPTGKKKTTSRKPAPKKEEVKKEETKAEPKQDVDAPATTAMPTTELSYAEAVAAIRSPFVDEEWEAFRTEVEEALAAINIEADMNPGTLKKAVASLSKLRQKIWSPYQDTKTLYEQLVSKEPEGLIERVKKVNLGDGTNDLHRKKAGIEACMSYIPPAGGSPINLYELLDETRARHNFLKNSMESISFKSQALITMNGALKLEGNLQQDV